MLGEFGEVLVMDWGLAQPSAAFRRKDSIVENTTMGGTPAYMAPEMATGPITKVTPQSDVYLLGAILFEILTDMPPHAGKTAMKCLMAAARNEIVETDQEGELIAVAMKAMATDPNDRYQSVMDFQASIREYLSHSESVQMTVRAEDDLSEAGRLGDMKGLPKPSLDLKKLSSFGMETCGPNRVSGRPVWLMPILPSRRVISISRSHCCILPMQNINR